VNPFAVGADAAPLSPSEKVQLTIRNLTSPQTAANRLIRAGYHQLTDYPTEWDTDAGGFAQRFASRYAKMALREGIQLSTDIAFKTDPRYDRCKCSGFRRRSAHAFKRVFVARTDSGGQMINVSNLAGAYVTQIISDQWYPSRLNTWDHHFKGGSTYLGFQVGSNMLKEFWPEIKRVLPFKRR
jgi:hypothetical protein